MTETHTKPFCLLNTKVYTCRQIRPRTPVWTALVLHAHDASSRSLSLLVLSAGLRPALLPGTAARAQLKKTFRSGMDVVILHFTDYPCLEQEVMTCARGMTVCPAVALQHFGVLRTALLLRVPALSGPAARVRAGAPCGLVRL